MRMKMYGEQALALWSFVKGANEVTKDRGSHIMDYYSIIEHFLNSI